MKKQRRLLIDYWRKLKVKKYSIFFLFIVLSNLAFAQFNSIQFNKHIESVSLSNYSINDNGIEANKDTIYSNDSIRIAIDILKLYSLKQSSMILDTITSNNEFTLPLKDIHVTSNYGNRIHPVYNKLKFHAGVDLRANRDTIYSIQESVVLDSGYDNKLGHYLKLGFLNYEIIYGHLQYYFFKKGETVPAGVPIGITGNTGLSTAPHLHFSVKKDGRYINPLDFIKNILRANKIADLNNT